MTKEVYQVENFDTMLELPGGNKINMELANFEGVLKAGLEEKINFGIAEILYENEGIAIVYFPKYAPSRPYESMICVFSKIENKIINDINFLSSEEQIILFKYIFEVEKALITVAKANNHHLEEIYSFIHYGPLDLSAEEKKPYHTSFTSLHFHIQGFGGHSLAEFPEVFHRVDTDFEELEGVRRIVRDPSSKIMLELLTYLGYEVSIKNHGAIVINSSDIRIFSEIISYWNELWPEVASCFIGISDRVVSNLLPISERLKKIGHFCDKYELTQNSRRLLVFLAKRIKPEELDEWMSFYEGPNGCIGFKLDADSNERELLIAPRVFRSWMKHYPLVESQEIVVKDEFGSGEIDIDTRLFMVNMHKMILQEL